MYINPCKSKLKLMLLYILHDTDIDYFYLSCALFDIKVITPSYLYCEFLFKTP